ncbi:MAG TPA: wax ester/triacylglycerol synthase family O-acyltransferase [Vicinamibacteria bacterium]|nr:wax ester/triacylglycerol synthase family O-acyltransferase [Vicinamibacteria bacterium]
MPDSVHDGTPLGAVDTAWLHMEQRTNLMMVTGLFLLDGPLDVHDLRETLRERVTDRFPRMRYRVRENGSGARWVRDPEFDLRTHVHRMALPRPGGLPALREVVSDLMSTPLDFAKPLWQCHLIERPDEGCAVLMRLHHCIGDGLALGHLLLSMTDRVPWIETHAAPTRPTYLADQVGWLADQAGAMIAAVLRGGMRAGWLVGEGIDAIRHPSHAATLARAVAEGAGIVYDLLKRPCDPSTPLRGPLGVAKKAAWSRSIPLDDVKRIGERSGATVNDVLLAAIAGGLRRYLSSRGTPPGGLEIHATVPVNLRPPEQADDLGNRFGLVQVALPVGVRWREQRLHLVHERMQALKVSQEALVAFQLLGALGRAPRRVADFFLNLLGSKSTAVMTNVIGPRWPVYLCGRRVDSLMFWVPQSARMGVGVSILSYAGQVTVGVSTDEGLVPDPEAIVAAFESEVRALRRPVRQRRRAGVTPARLRLPARG